MAAPTAAEVKAQVKTTYTDETVQEILLQAEVDVVEQVGPRFGDTVGYVLDFDPELTELIELSRRAATITTVVEYTDARHEPTKTTLAANDYELSADKGTLRRLSSGTNARSVWGWHVELIYDPADDDIRRNQVLIQLCRLEINYRSSQSESVGDFSRQLLDHERERNRIMRRLVYRGLS